MKLERLRPREVNGLPLHPIRITLDRVFMGDIEHIHKQHNIPLFMSGRHLYYTSEQEALMFMLAYNE